MKVLLITVLLFFCSCKAVQKSTDTAVSVSASSSVVAETSQVEQEQGSTKKKRFSVQGYISNDSMYEKVTEETVYEFTPRQEDSLWDAAVAKVIQASRVIREKGSVQRQELQQSSGEDSVQQQSSIRATKAMQAGADSSSVSRQTSRRVQRTGTPWYVWGGGAAIIAAAVWWKKRQLFTF